MPRVQHEGHARQIDAANLVRELRGLQTRGFFLDAGGVVGRTELGRQVRDRDLDRKSDGDGMHIRDPASLGDLRRLGVDVLGVHAARETNHDGRIESLALSQAVDRIAASLVRAILDPWPLLGCGRRGGNRFPERGGQQLARHHDELARDRLERGNRRRLPDLLVVRAVARKPLRDPPQGFGLSGQRRDPVLPAGRRGSVFRIERLDGDLAEVVRQEAVGNADEAVRAQEPDPAVAGQDFLLGLRIIRQALDKSVYALVRQRARGQHDLVSGLNGHADLGRDHDRLLVGGRTKGRRQRRRQQRRRADRSSGRPEEPHPESRRPSRRRAPRQRPPPLRSEAREPGCRAEARRA